MPKAYSGDLRERVVEAVSAGASRREAARRFSVSVSSAIRWTERQRETGSVAASPVGGSSSPLDQHAGLLLGMIAAEPDLILDEVRQRLADQGIACGRTAVWRFFDRHGISFKKNSARQRARSS